MKICDFSCAVKRDDIGRSGRAGTQAYMAPEMKNTTKRYDEKADYWAFGCVLYYMAVGRLPFKV